METGQVLRGSRLRHARDIRPCTEAEVCEQEVPSRIRLQLRLRDSRPGEHMTVTSYSLAHNVNWD